jgi:hypothetical protein
MHVIIGQYIAHIDANKTDTQYRSIMAIDESMNDNPPADKFVMSCRCAKLNWAEGSNNLDGQ